MALSDTSIRNARPAGKPYKLADEGGLYLYVTVSGGRLWRMDYRYGGKRKTLSLGAYPDVGLAEARDKAHEARKALAGGKDPGEAKKASKAEAKAEQARAESTFGLAAWAWFNHWKSTPPKAETNVAKVKGRLEKDVLPWLGSKPIADVTPHDVFTACERIQARGAIETAHRVLGDLDAIFKHVMAEDAKDKDIAEGRAKPRVAMNPCTNLRGRNVHLLQPSPPKRHFAHFKDERTGAVSTAKLGEYLRAVDAFRGSYVVMAALQLAPMLFCRPGEMRKARWGEIDLTGNTWSFTISKAKPNEAPGILVVPLPRQAIEILGGLYPLTGRSEFVFAGHRDSKRPMSDAAVNAAIRRMGFDTKEEISGHGFRHVASTLLYDLGYSSDAVEKSLGHKTRGIRGVYDHAQYLDERAPMMQAWADYLDRLKNGADVIPLRVG
ncbi:MAG: integrase arm-type DNA-binding domain-containing protein [Proteobacteria bacterium]|nr:integrase arm-type DNA-binding domain-containing protein [Pseudomonadota bacterium]